MTDVEGGKVGGWAHRKHTRSPTGQCVWGASREQQNSTGPKYCSKFISVPEHGILLMQKKFFFM
jgi:hypothetical protein